MHLQRSFLQSTLEQGCQRRKDDVVLRWFWLLIPAAGDLFCRKDVSGLGKVRWLIPRNEAQAIQARDELRQVVGFSIADELTKLDRPRSERSISDEEYSRLRARLVA